MTTKDKRRRRDSHVKTETESSEALMAVIYGLRTPRSEQYVYVGQSLNPDQRLRHYRSGGKQHSQLLQTWISSVGTQNVQMDILETVPAIERFHRECAWINQLREDGAPLLNRVGKPDISWISPTVAIEGRNAEIRQYLAAIPSILNLYNETHPIVEGYLLIGSVLKQDCARFPEGIDPLLRDRLNAAPVWPEDKTPQYFTPERRQLCHTQVTEGRKKLLESPLLRRPISPEALQVLRRAGLAK